MLIESLLYDNEVTPEPAGAAAVPAPDPLEPPEAPPAGAEAVEPPAPEEEPAGEMTEEEAQEALRDFIREEIFNLNAGPSGYVEPEPFDPAIAGATPGPMQQPFQPPGIQGPVFDWSQVDPYSEDFGARLGSGIEQTVIRAMGAFMGPMTARMEADRAAEAAERGDELVQDMIAAEVSAGPELTDESKALIEPLAESLMPELQQKYGSSPRVAEMAIRQAADRLRAIEQAGASRGVTTHQNQVAGLQSAPPSPPPAGHAAATAAAAPAGSPLEAAALARKYGVGR